MSLIKTVVLADASARVPWPGAPGRLLPATPFEISLGDAFFAALVADRTLIDPPAPPEDAPAKKLSRPAA